MSLPRFTGEEDQCVSSAARGREINEFPRFAWGGRWAMFGRWAWVGVGCWRRFTDWIPDRVRNDVVGLGLDSSARCARSE